VEKLDTLFEANVELLLKKDQDESIRVSETPLLDPVDDSLNECVRDSEAMFSKKINN
jgi:hypothetical protein